MRELFDRVLELQDEYSSDNTPAMVERGQLIRRTIPNEMLAWAATHVGAAAPYEGRLATEGSDGMGRKTYVPWSRIYAPERSPSAQNGWYVVYLFRADGGGAYLCISHGSSSFNGMSFVKRSTAEMAPLLAWARELLEEQAVRLGFDPGGEIDLATNVGVGAMYQATTIYQKYYPRDAIPDDRKLAADARDAVSLVGRLYHAEVAGRVPGVENAEMMDAQLAIDEVIRPLRRSAGQGFGLTHPQRCAVERYAMNLARAWLRTNGYYDIVDVSGGSPFDFEATRHGTKYIVEVKGTTGLLGMIGVTKNEVEAHREAFPNNLLIVVAEIDLNKATLATAGGNLTEFEQWAIDECTLTPMSYRCELVL